MSVFNHSPLPWRHNQYHNKLVDADGREIICSNLGIGLGSPSMYPEGPANSELIVRAVNAHESLYEALKALLNTPHNADIQTRLAVIRQANDALAKAAPAERKG